MSTQIELPKTFEEKLRGKILDQFADLIDAETLKKVIERGIEDACFKERIEVKRREYGYGEDRIIHPSFVQTVVLGIVENQIKTEVILWLDAHPEFLQKALENAVKNGAMGIIESVLNARFQSMLFDLQHKVSQQDYKLSQIPNLK